MCGSLRSSDLFKKKRRFSCISPTEHDILGMFHGNSLKTRVLLSKLVSIDSIRWTLQAEYKNMWVSLRNSDLFKKKRRFSCISPTEHDILGMIKDNSLKTRVIPSKLVSIDSIRWTLQAEHKNMCVSLRNNDLFSKKRRFSCISPTELDILGMIDDISLKTCVIASKLGPIDKIRWTLHGEHKNMCVSSSNNDLFSKKRRFSCISPTELDILGMIDDKSLKTRVIPSKLAPIDKIRWTLKAEHKNMYLSLRNNDLFSKKRRFSCISTTEHDILGMTDDNSLNIRVILPKLVSIDRIC